MIVRALDINGDWTFGKGQNNYKKRNQATAQIINSRLNSFLGDCFFDLGAGIDWFTFLGSKNQIGLNLAISSTILNTPDVTGILQVFSNLNHVTRKFTVSYKVTTTYSVLTGSFEYDQNAIS